MNPDFERRSLDSLSQLLADLAKAKVYAPPVEDNAPLGLDDYEPESVWAPFGISEYRIRTMPWETGIRQPMGLVFPSERDALDVCPNANVRRITLKEALKRAPACGIATIVLTDADLTLLRCWPV